jgi:hypothetical protein
MSTDTLIFYNSRWKNGCYAVFAFAAFVLLTGGAISACVKPDVSFDLFEFSAMTLFGLFFGYSSYFCVRRLLDSKPVVILDQHGVFSRESRYGLIPWSEISQVSTFTPTRSLSSYLRLTLVSPEKRFKDLPQAGQIIKKMSGSKVANFQFLFLTPGVDQAKAFIEKQIVERNS